MTLGVVKRTEEEFGEWLATEWGFLSGLGSFDDEPLELESYQLAFLENRAERTGTSARGESQQPPAKPVA